MGTVIMGKVSEQEDAWQAEATAQAVADARTIAQSQLANMPAGRLNDQQWGWIISAALFAWIRTRYQQAITEGLDRESHVIQMQPSPHDSAVAHAAEDQHSNSRIEQQCRDTHECDDICDR